MSNLIIKDVSIKDIIKNISLKFSSDEITNILGGNGSGKSTLAKAIAKLKDYDGVIEVDNSKDYNVGLVFQNPSDQFIRSIVEDDLAFSLEGMNLTKEEMRDEIQRVAKYFNISNLLDRHVITLSGGERQKVAIVANLLLNPKVLILDESFEMIDQKAIEDILNKIREYVKEKDIICIHITHNLNFINNNDKVTYLENGEVEYEGSGKDFFNNKDFLEKHKIDSPLSKRLEIELGIEHTKDGFNKLCKSN